MTQPNMRLIVENLHDTAWLDATSEALPVRYTQRSERVRAWRSTSTDTQVITATLPSPRFLDAVVVYRHNLSSGSRVTLELLNGDDVVYDTGPVNVLGMVPLGEFRFGIDPWGATVTDNLPVKQAPFWFPATLVSSYRLTITDADNPDGYLQIGRIIAGEVLSPEYNPAYGVPLVYEEASEHSRTEGHSLRTIGGGEQSRKLSLDLAFVSEIDRQAITNSMLPAGRKRDVYVSVFPERGGVTEAEYAFLARRQDDFQHTHDFFNNWQIPLTFIEV